jgi:hypothetical protein
MGRLGRLQTGQRQGAPWCGWEEEMGIGAPWLTGDTLSIVQTAWKL